ncbi:recombinase family protein [Alphaproteobacteria bacterium]|nr:recombinase family protein [Alphaproteobacteria bacterium]
MNKGKEMKRAVLYLRVSKHEQTIENQRIELERVAKAKGWKVIATFKDEGVSGAFGREVRAQYDLMLKQGVQAKFDVILAWDVSRLSRSLVDLVTTLDELHACGIDLYLHQQAIDTTTPAGKAMFQMCGVFAEFERGILSERVKAGLNRAKEEGKTLGRPMKFANIKKIVEDRGRGKTIRQIANEQRLSVGKVHKLLNGEQGVLLP